MAPGGEGAAAKRAQQLATHTPNVLIADQDTQMPHRKDTKAITFFVDVSGRLAVLNGELRWAGYGRDAGCVR